MTESTLSPGQKAPSRQKTLRRHRRTSLTRHHPQRRLRITMNTVKAPPNQRPGHPAQLINRKRPNSHLNPSNTTRIIRNHHRRTQTIPTTLVIQVRRRRNSLTSHHQVRIQISNQPSHNNTGGIPTNPLRHRRRRITLQPRRATPPLPNSLTHVRINRRILQRSLNMNLTPNTRLSNNSIISIKNANKTRTIKSNNTIKSNRTPLSVESTKRNSHQTTPMKSSRHRKNRVNSSNDVSRINASSRSVSSRSVRSRSVRFHDSIAIRLIGSSTDSSSIV